jgi:hypothetical protein
MEFTEIFSRYFDDAQKIHALCFDYSMSRSAAKLLTYLHVKGCESGEGVEYFRRTHPGDVAAILCLLGEQEVVSSCASALEQEQADFIRSTAHELAAIERRLQEEEGIEQAFTPELRLRLRLHTDTSFREQQIEIYQLLIKPGLSTYSNDDVQASIGRSRTLQQQEQHRLNCMLS